VSAATELALTAHAKVLEQLSRAERLLDGNRGELTAMREDRNRLRDCLNELWTIGSGRVPDSDVNDALNRAYDALRRSERMRV
jgi:hypothetical protein